MKIDNNSKTHIIGQITRLKVLFASYSAAHGRCKPGKAPPGEKVKAKSYTVHSLVTDQTWQEHLTGHDEGLGLIPLLDDGISVKWAAIDIDDNSIDHAELERHVQDRQLPLVTCRSKSGGAHCYLFLEEPCLAKDVVEALENWAAALGYPGVEIFPKQTKRMPDKAGKPHPGNWINLPYFGGENTLPPLALEILDRRRSGEAATNQVKGRKNVSNRSCQLELLEVKFDVSDHFRKFSVFRTLSIFSSKISDVDISDYSAL